MKKKIIKIKGDKKTIDYKECIRAKLPLTLRYLAPYWHTAIQNVNSYVKRRDFVESHKLLSDDRIKKGLELYRNKKIIESTITTEKGGDVHSIVESEDGKRRYRVIVKDYLPEKLPQYIHEREEFIANLRLLCNCDDHIIGRYKHNASVCCKHICSIIFYLINNYDFPKIFILPGETIVGWQKSETQEIETEIQALPLVLFTQHINILLLDKYRGMKPALGISIHKIDNKTHQDRAKPQWLTYTEPQDVKRLIQGMTHVLNKMCDMDEQYIFERRTPVIDTPEKKPSLWERIKARFKD